jgi:two-component system, OmpR family, sensor histidine kinase MprB
MSLRRRLTLMSAASVAIAIVAASAVVWFVVRGDLRAQVDDSLRDLAGGASVAPAPAPPGGGRTAIPILPRRDRPGRHAGIPSVVEPRGQAGRRRSHPFLALPQQSPGGPGAYSQVVTRSGEILRPPGQPRGLPATEAARRVAAGRAGSFFSDAVIEGTHLRVLTQRIGPGIAVQVARSLDDVDGTMRSLALVLGIVAAAGVALAALLGWAISRATLRPVARLTETAEHVAETRDLGSRIEVPDRGDELSRLAASFNSMLAELEGAVGAQRRLVADASHELRTPLTSLRTNLEVLAREDGLDQADRSALLADVVTELGELGSLVADLVELARDDDARAPRPEPVELDDLVAGAVERARRHSRDVRFETELSPCVVRGDRERLDRAVSNLLDNAAEWTPPGSRVKVALSAGGELAIRDHGPGIDPVDLPHVFDRFYRSAASRGRPGSGLGLAIVREVARSHGGFVEAESAPGGGTVLRLRLPRASGSANSSAPLS